MADSAQSANDPGRKQAARGLHGPDPIGPLLATAGEPVALWGPDQRLVAASDAYADHFGAPGPNRLVGSAATRLWSDAVRSGRFAETGTDPVGAALAGYRSDRSWSLTRSDGRRFSVTTLALAGIGCLERWRPWTGDESETGAPDRTQARLIDAIESLDAGFVIFDGKGRLILANREIQRMFPGAAELYQPGTPLEKIIAANASLVSEAQTDLRDWTNRRLVEIRDTGQKVQEFRLVDGRVIRGIDRPTQEGGLVALRIDVTAEKQLVEALRDGQERLRVVLDSAAEAIITTDSRDRIVDVNPAAERIFGMSADAMEGRRFASLLTDDEAQYPVRPLSEFVTGDGSAANHAQSLEVRGHGEDGQTIPLELSVAGWHSKGARHYTGFLRDIRARKQAEARLVHAQKMEAIGQLTGGVAHDFNNLLAVALGNIELALEQLDNETEPHLLINHALRAVRRGADLTQRLLTFAREQPIRPAALNLNRIIRNMEPLLRRSLGETIEIRLDLGEDLWLCEADLQQLENVILNLAINARDAMPGGGTLSLCTGNNAGASNGETPGTRRDTVFLTVSDTGQGMAQSVRAGAFEPFFTTKEIGHGSGLGLSTAYGFITQSGGTIAIESTVAGGTTVRIDLPRLANPEGDMADSETAAAMPAGKGELVLVVEDDAPLRWVTRQMLESLGYRVVDVAHGKAALTALEENPEIAVVLSDMVLPGGMSGIDLADWLAAHGAGQQVLLTSGHGRSEDRDDPRLGHYPMVRKPYRKSDLATALHQALAR